MWFRLLTMARRSALGRAWYRRRWRQRADVVMLSFPKAGRTWLRVLVTQALLKHFGLPAQPLPAIARLSGLHSAIPRIVTRHDDNPHLHTPKELVHCKSEYAGRKVILVYRSLPDLAVSSYFQMTKREKRFTGSISEFIRCPRGGVDSMLEFYNIWARNQHRPAGFLLVRYEDLHADTLGELARTLEFIGVSGVSRETLAWAVEQSSFDNMRKMELANAVDSKWLQPGDASDPESYKTRKGKVGGYVDYLSVDDIAYIENRVSRLDSMYLHPAPR